MSDGLLHVLSEPGEVPLDEFQHWYDTEHAPARLRVPGVHAAHRFRAADDLSPGWLAIYPLDLAALDSPAYAAARVRSPHEQMVVARLAVLDRRVYERIGEAGAPGPCPLLLTVALTSTDPDGLDAWYDDEHLPMLRQVPGWLRTVRYRRVEGAGPDRLAMHELAGPAVFETPQYARATSTPRRDAVARTIIARERRLFTHHRTLTH